jgi:serine phosphatase RsbU (regulator of sigma subunit)
MTTQVPASVLSSLDVAGGWRIEVAPESKLRAILEISRNLGTSLDLKEVLPKILESLFTVFPRADRGFILLRDPNTTQLVPRAVRQRRERPGEKPVVSRTVVNYALNTGQAVLCADVGSDERFDVSESIRSMQLRSVMCVPLLSQAGSGLGVIQIDTLGKQYLFGQEDLDVLVGAATQAARAVELAQLHQQLRDLESATQIQKSFLPDAPPRVPGLRFFDHYSPARHVGGDYYDYIPLPGNRLAIALGDVSGKGVPAALLMARLSAAARFCLATEPSVAAAVRQLNTSLIRTGTEDRFATFLVLVLDLARFTMTIVNAGHMPPLRCRGSRPDPEEIGGNEAGMPLATFDQPYEEVVVPLGRGDTYLLYTDGVTEARNANGEFYGFDRLRAVIERTPADAAMLGQTIVEDVKEFTGNRPPADDIALVCFTRDA